MCIMAEIIAGTFAAVIGLYYIGLVVVVVAQLWRHRK